MGKMFDHAEKAAFEQWGRRHEQELIRYHRFKVMAIWVIVGLIALWFIGASYVMPFIEKHLMIIGITAGVVLVVVILRIIFAMTRSSIPRAPRGFR